VSWTGIGISALLALFLLVALNGFIIVQPNQAKVAVSYEEGQESLRGAADRGIATLQADLQERLDVAGVAVVDTRLRRLAYAPEIAADMLRRQQADAIVAARQRIVEGAVGMVDHALSSLNERDIVDLDEERKAAMVSNLMVVLVSDRGAQPVVNSGSLYT
jgi:regulator of protease activity HflC (stomatin/prohibitin superfamily)